MVEPKWTAGPWFLGAVDEWFVDAPGDFEYWHVKAKGRTVPVAIVTDRTFSGLEPNARLIAAAPDMAVQLEDAKVTLEEAAKLLVKHYPSVANNLVNQCAIRCGDVLAKARGDAG